ncbi:MAG TPA: biotin attachment protein [Kiritimatiellia bacterium]|nr:biotin attachment protein [Kiritimatiellia bacterium]HMO98436.1 biotin attachment protein [Kiritimatiellia bacterium]HMP95854.1 biotin attachment protein [Kiritimatiellia bacterium]
MIHTGQKKTIRVMLTAFRDGVQSVFGGKVRVNDLLPAMQAAAEAGIRHFEFGGGARYQAPYFYVGEDPFVCMDRMREAVGPEADLQILTRSVSGVTLTNQPADALKLQARLMKKHGTTIDRNFDFMNDIGNLVKTGAFIVDAGMHHQVCVAMMGLPYASDRVHTPEFYITIVRELLATGIRIDSVCMKDASGTTDPRTCYETARGLKKILPPEIPLLQHTHDTASMAVACYMAGIAGGVDGIDLSVRPLASGTSQPDVRSMWHALKGTGFSLDVDHTKMDDLEGILDDGLRDYQINPITLAADARVVNFPMPGGAIGPNVQMMEQAGILDKYSHVLAEFPVVVKAGGAWASVTPGSQQYWLQAFNNVLHGRWSKIDPGYGRSVLGYFGRPPESPDPDVVRIATEQLKLPVFEGDPLASAPDTLGEAEKALRERSLPVTEESIFLVASAIVPGKQMELNEGIRFLSGKARINLPLKKKEDPSKPVEAASTPVVSRPFTTTCTVAEGATTRTFRITIEPPGGAASGSADAVGSVASSATAGIPVFSPFEGKVELVEINVKAGDMIKQGQIVAAVEAMKAKHEVRAPADGKVAAVHAALGAEVTSGHPIMTLEP